jgi:DNA-binding NarL/FixJ family response regulator
VVAEASDGGQAVQLAETHQPDLAVVDIGMKPMNGIDAASRIRRCAPHTAVMMLTMHCNPQYVARSVSAGARGYLLKDSLEEAEFVSAIRQVSAGGSYFSPQAAIMLPPPAAA